MKKLSTKGLMTAWLSLVLVLAACTPQANTTTAPAYNPPAATQPAATATTASPTAATTAIQPEVAASPTAASEAQVAAGAVQFAIVPEESEARYRIREQLANMDLPIDAVGVTNAISGAVTMNADGSIDSANSQFTVDLSTLKSDRSNRDNYVRNNILKTGQYPNAVFVPTQVSGLPTPLPASGDVSFQVTGDLTLLGVTESVTWDVTGSFDGQQARGQAATSFPFEKFNLPLPRVPIVLSVNNEIKLEVDVVLRVAAGTTSSTSAIPATGSESAAAPHCSSPVALTPAMTEGPYYTANPPQTSNLYQEGIPGTRLTLTGTVLDSSCQPVPGARVDFWQADGEGVYDNSGYTLRGYQLTDNNGRYQLVTVVPGLYPGRTEHIHVKVQAPGGLELTTQLFFPDVAQNQADRIFDNSLLVQNFSDGPDGKTATFNFVVATR